MSRLQSSGHKCTELQDVKTLALIDNIKFNWQIKYTDMLQLARLGPLTLCSSWLHSTAQTPLWQHSNDGQRILIIQRLITASTRARHLTVLWARLIQSTALRHISLWKVILCRHFLSGFPTKTLNEFLFSPHMPHAPPISSSLSLKSCDERHKSRSPSIFSF